MQQSISADDAPSSACQVLIEQGSVTAVLLILLNKAAGALETCGLIMMMFLLTAAATDDDRSRDVLLAPNITSPYLVTLRPWIH